MATQVQRRRGTTTEHSTFTGAEGELTVDTTKDTVVVHDGATAGGQPLAREDLDNVSSADVTAKVSAATTSAAGKVQLEDSTTSTSTTTAATPNSVKVAKDAADAAQTTANNALATSGGTITGPLTIGTDGSLTFEGSTTDDFETTLAITDPTADRTITLPDINGTLVTTGDTGTVTSTMIADGTIADGDISASAEIAVSKLADGAARQLLQTDAAGTGVEWTDNVDVPGTLDVTGNATFDANVTVEGDLTVNGTTTTIDTETLLVKDKNIEMGVVDTPTDTTADGGGITLKGTTDKTINWVDSTDSWTSSENIDLASGKTYKIAGTDVLSATALGSAVQISSANIPAGTVTNDDLAGSIADSKLNTISTAGKVSNSATTATDANTASAIVARDASGNFSAGTITADLDGNASTVTTNANLTGDVTSVGNATSIAAGVIVDGDVNASAAIAGTKISPDFGSQAVQTTGSLLVGTTTSRNNSFGNAAIAQLETTGATAALQITRNSFGADSPILSFGKTRAETLNGVTVVSDGDQLGAVNFEGADGDALVLGAQVRAEVDGTPGENQMPGRIVFSTNPGTTSAAPAERLRITASGEFEFIGAGTAGTDQAVYFNGSAPVDSLVIDSNGRVGLGVSSPGAAIDVSSDIFTRINNSTAPTLSNDTHAGEALYIRSGGSAGDDNVQAVLAFGKADGSSGRTGSAIGSVQTDADADRVGLAFYTSGSAASSQTLSERVRITHDGNVGIGTTSPGTILDIREAQTGGETKISVFNTDTADTTTQTASIGLSPDSRASAVAGIEAIKVNADFSTNAGRDVALALNTTLNNAKNQAVYITHGGNVGIGTASPDELLHVELASTDTATIKLENEDGFHIFKENNGNLTIADSVSDRIRIDSSGRLLVGASSARANFFNTTDTPLLQIEGANDNAKRYLAQVYGSTSAAGPWHILAKHRSGDVGDTTLVNDDDQLGGITFQGADGTHFVEGARILAFVDGTPALNEMPARLSFYTNSGATNAGPTERMRIESDGKLNITSGNTIYASTSTRCGIFFSTSTAWMPTDNTGTASDNSVSLGTASIRMSEIFAGTGTINTSDATLKQDVENLDAAELTVATAIKSLIKKYRFTDAVNAKGDDARIHVGVIAQEVEQVFLDAGLDASRYALFCRDTWYEVEGSPYDSDGNEFTADTPGAVEKTRLGIRYAELLAFVIAAM